MKRNQRNNYQADRVLRKHMKADKVNWLISITSFVLVIATIIVGFCSSWTFWMKKEAPKEEQKQEQQTPGGGMVINPEQNQGESGGNGGNEGGENLPAAGGEEASARPVMRLMSARIAEEDYEDYGISPLAETAQQLTATITPSNAANKKVNWTVRWKNASSSWATGKNVTDYVTITPTADGALTANAECKKAFSEQVQVVVTSRDNTAVSATATVDYVKRINTVTATLKQGSTSVSAIKLGDGKVYTFGYTNTWTDGTITPTIQPVSYTLGVTNSEVAQAFGGTKALAVPGTNITANADWHYGFCATNPTEAQKISKNNALIAAVNKNSTATHFQVSITLTATYNNETINSQSTAGSYKFDVSGLSVRVEGMTISDNIWF